MSMEVAAAPAEAPAPIEDAKPEEAAKAEKPAAEGKSIDDEEEGAVAKLKRHLAAKRGEQIKARAADTGPSRGPDGKFLPKEKAEGDEKPAAEAKEEPAKEEKPAKVEAKEAPKDKPAEPKAEKPSADVAKAQEKLEKAGADVPEQRKDESDAKYEHRLARALLDLKTAKAEAIKAKEEAAKASGVLQAIERLKGDKISQEDLELATGRTFEQLVRDVAQGKAKYAPKANLPPELAALQSEMKATLDAIKAREEAAAKAEQEKREAEERTKAEAKRQEAFKNETSQVDEYIKEEVEKYPHLSSLPNAGEKVLRRWYATWEESGYAPDKMPNLEDFMLSMETTLSGEVGAIFTSERSIRAALANPSTRELVSKLLGTHSQKTPEPTAQTKGNPAKAQSEGPTTLSNKVTQEVPALKDRQLTPEEEHAAMLERFRSSPFRQTARR